MRHGFTWRKDEAISLVTTAPNNYHLSWDSGTLAGFQQVRPLMRPISIDQRNQTRSNFNKWSEREFSMLVQSQAGDTPTLRGWRGPCLESWPLITSTLKDDGDYVPISPTPKKGYVIRLRLYREGNHRDATKLIPILAKYPYLKIDSSYEVPI
ncbi:hypothetical protein EG329_006772 [Mollisiaceae sp. DMI_Dod_QoI]|nr:hypothetical protein EG329_006772 [Helotiales sp. DMI_Dod_QoI]